MNKSYKRFLDRIEQIRSYLKSRVDQDEKSQVDNYCDELECEDDHVLHGTTDRERLVDFKLYQTFL